MPKKLATKKPTPTPRNAAATRKAVAEPAAADAKPNGASPS